MEFIYMLCEGFVYDKEFYGEHVLFKMRKGGGWWHNLFYPILE